MLSFFGWIMQNSVTGHDYLIYKPLFFVGFFSKNNDIVIHAVTMTSNDLIHIFLFIKQTNESDK